MIPARRWLPLVLLVGLVGGSAVVRLQQHIDRTMADYRTEEQLLYLSSGAWIKRLSLGYNGLLACIYWTRAVQHYGREHIAQGQYKLLYPLLDITTSLDPELLLAYRFGSIFLSLQQPQGAGRPDLAVNLLEKGIRANPDYWRFWQDLGLVYYEGMKDYQKASAAFAEGAKHPEAASWMKVMSAKIAAEGGTREHARFLWSQLYKSTDDPTIRSSALHHLYGLQADDEIELLQRLVDRYRERAGRSPASFGELVEAGMLSGLPVDPLGHPYRLSPEGKVLLDRESPLIFTAILGHAG